MDLRFHLMLLGCAAAGLGGLRLAAPERTDLLAAAAAGAAFAAGLGCAGYEWVRRANARSPVLGIRVFLAVMTVKVLAFGAFLLTVALTTSLNPAGLASGLMGVTLLGEALAIEGLVRARPGAGPPAGPAAPDSRRDRD